MPAPRTDKRWFVSRLSYAQASRTVLAGDSHRNRLVAIFDTPEEAGAAVREHNERLNEKGPASAATDPDHDPNNPCEENAVSEQKPTPVPAVPATPNPLQPFKDFAFNIEGEMLQVRAEIIACHEMLSPRSAIEHDVREAIGHLVASAYARLDRIRDAHSLAYETAKKRRAA